MSQPSQIVRALRIGLAALCTTAVYETTKVICFPRMSVVQSHIITIFFAGYCAEYRWHLANEIPKHPALSRVVSN